MKIIYNLLAFTFFLSCFNCTDEIPLDTQSFEDILVVEAIITNELKRQEVKLSRTYFLEDSNQIIEDNATVVITDNQGNTYNFTQNSEGAYISNVAFKAIPNTGYTLSITTSKGKQYLSLQTELSPVSQIDDLYAEVSSGGTSPNNIQVLLNSNNETTNAQYFRYEFTETHKIVVPYYSWYNLEISNIIDDGIAFDLNLVPKLENQRICFTTNSSNNIIQTSTNALNQNIINKLQIRTIDKDDPLIRERYSIIVKQYVQNPGAYNFYKKINELGNNESLLSQNQPGYIIGNISAVNNEKERIIGYFDVSSVTSKRIYFNFQDLNLPQPKYPYDCDYRTDELEIANYNKNHLKLNYALNGGNRNHRAQLYKFLSPDWGYKYKSGIAGIYFIVSPECGDCTSYSSNIHPDFWEA
ncbi:MAG: DUF4249 domain-containing protein [Bizionia sp.]|nr:DUF4249 domain-containing protein [Bizionia sp.]